MKTIYVGISIVFLLGMTACSGNKKNKEISHYVSALYKSNPEIVAVGKVDYSALLEKSEISKTPKLGKLIASEKERLDRSLTTKTPMYAALQAPFDKNGNPSATYFFLEVNNADSLESRLGYSGFFVEKSGDLRYAVDGDMSVGFEGNLAIIVLKKEKYDAKALLTEVFKQVDGDRQGGRIDALLGVKEDLHLAMSLERLYATANTELNRLDEAKQKELKQLVSDSYVEMSLRFLNGVVELETKNTFSTNLKKRLFFKDNQQDKLANRLGKGKAKLGLSVQADVALLESFLDDFLPDAKRKLFKMNAQLQMASLTMGDKPLQSLLDGSLAAILVGDPLKDGSFTPEVNFYVALGKRGNSLSDMLNAFMQMESGKAVAVGQSFNYNGMSWKVTSDAIQAQSLNVSAANLDLPPVAADFGKHGMDLFIDLQDAPIQTFGFRGGMKALELVQDVRWSMTNKGSILRIQLKEKDKNVLSQVLQFFLKDIEKQLSAFSV